MRTNLRVPRPIQQRSPMKKRFIVNTKKNDDVPTPPLLKEELSRVIPFNDFDPCPLYGLENGPNGLNIDWAQTTFVNPPYSKVKVWIQKSIEEWKKGKTTSYPASTSTHYWHC